MDRATEGTRWIFVAYLALIVWVPIPLGSNRPWAWALLACWVFALALWWLAGVVRGRRACPSVLRETWSMLACCVAWLAYVWFQLLPLPMGLLEWLSPVAARWHMAAAAPDVIAAAPLTLDRYNGLESALKSTAYVVFFVLSLVLLGSRDRIRIATYVIVISGEIEMEMDASRVTLKAGDVMGQRGTHHAWVTRSSEYARVAFVLIDAKPLAIGHPVTGAVSAGARQS